MKYKLTYQYGELIPPSKYLAYIEDVEPKQDKTNPKKQRRRVKVRDIRNNEEFIADFNSIRSGETVNSPGMASKISSQRMKKRWADADNSIIKPRKHKVGDIIGPDKNILIIKDYPPVYNSTCHRKCIFKNLDTGVIFEGNISNVVSGFTYGLSLEHKSKGECKIYKILSEHNILFYQEYKFKELQLNKYSALRFDFYLPDYNCCIEYDGLQHFENHFQVPEEKYQHQLQNDKIKNNFCKQNNILLIRIPYWEYNKLDWEYLCQRINF